MGTLVLVRHGQASFMAAEYDRLSETGEEQSRKLGQQWVARGVRLDAVYTGPRQRQQRMAEIVGEVYRAAGAPFPEPVLLEALDEMQAQLLLQRSVPDLLTAHPEVRALVDKLGAAAASGGNVHKPFHKMFEAVTEMWVSGQWNAPEVESWQAFSARVRSAIAAMTVDKPAGGAPEKSRRVAAFTSAGPVAAAMQYALATSDLATIRISFNVRNASVSEFLFSGSRFSLSLFNEVSHLDEDRLLTYR